MWNCARDASLRLVEDAIDFDLVESLLDRSSLIYANSNTSQSYCQARATARVLGPTCGFFANLLALFFGNEAETKSLADEVGEIDSYGGRLIPILNLIFRKGKQPSYS